MDDHALVKKILDNSQDFYSVLQVDKDASTSRIRRSYYKLSLKLHPDKNPGCSEEVTKAFQIVSRSYEVLKDSTTRSMYDQIGAEGLARFEKSGQGVLSVHEIFLAVTEIILVTLIRQQMLRMGAGRLIEHIYPSFLNSAKRKKGPYIQYTKQWDQFRRCVLIFLVSVIVVFLVLLGLDGVRHFQYNAGSPVQDISPAFSKSRFLFYAPKSNGETQRGYEMVLIYPFCILQSSVESFLACHSEAFSSEQFANLSRPKTQKWLVYQYGASDINSRVDFYTYMKKECQREELFAWASRQRFQKTATLQHKADLSSMRKINRSRKRKYREKVWYSKFHDTFSVTTTQDLFYPSHYCNQLWKSKASVDLS